MKSTNLKWLAMSAMAVMLGFTSCQEEEIEPIFPADTTQVAVAAGETSQVEFNANLDWQLSSDAVWCLLGEEQLQDISGKVGKQTIKLTITDDALDFEEATANITLKMGDRTMVIATVTRAAKEYELSLLNEDGEVVETVLIDYSGEASYTIDANFDFTISDKSLWLEASHYNNIVSFEVVADSVKNANNGFVIFENADASVKFEFPVEYAGMSPEEIYFNPGTAWNINVSADGTKYINGGGMGMTDSLDAPYTVTISAVNNEYVLYNFFADEYGWMQFDPWMNKQWYTIEDDAEGNLSITFEANSSSKRNGYILAFPQAIVDAMGDVEGTILDQNTYELKYEYEKYVVAEFIQEGVAVDGNPFDIKLYGFQDMEVSKVVNQDILDYVMGNCMYYGSEVYQVSAGPGSYLSIYPNLPADVWNCEIPPMILGVNEEMVIEPGNDGRDYIGLTVPNVEEPIFVAFRDEMWQFHKVLVILPY